MYLPKKEWMNSYGVNNSKVVDNIFERKPFMETIIEALITTFYLICEINLTLINFIFNIRHVGVYTSKWNKILST